MGDLEWGGGIKQKVNAEEDKAELTRIAAQPFARYEPDEKHMEDLRQRREWNDPMQKYVDEGDDAGANTRRSAQEVAEAQAKKKPKCPHAPWPNRYGIQTGYRWDGKVRGN